jgi:Aminoglycoside adenylyltransferase, C-terminal domain/Nucleotidyltransferase domain
MANEHPPAEVVAYCRQLAATLAVHSGGRLVGAYLHGSAAMGGWLASRSDVDLLVVLEDASTATIVDAVERALKNSADCPGTGLECSVVSATQAGRPSVPWPFLVHVQSSRGQPARSVRCVEPDGDPDLLMHYAVCREAAVPVVGPQPQAVFGAVPRSAVLGYLAAELRWGLEHGSEAYAVLNACRALVYAKQGSIISKIEGGRIALEQGLGPPNVVARALDEQRAMSPLRATSADAAAFVRDVADAL